MIRQATRRWLAAAAAIGGAVGLGLIAGRLLPPTEEAVRAYLEAHPAFLVDHPALIEQARPIAMERREAAARRQREETLAGAELIRRGAAPRVGGEGQPIMVVEFTDYACLPCKAIALRLEEIAASYPQMQLVVLYVPGADAAAELAARAALAVWRDEPGKFAEAHRALMAAPLEGLSVTIDEVLGGEAVPSARRRERVASPELRESLRQMRELAEDLGVRGVPSFLVQGELLAGAGALDALQRTIDEATHRGRRE